MSRTTLHLSTRSALIRTGIGAGAIALALGLAGCAPESSTPSPTASAADTGAPTTGTAEPSSPTSSATTGNGAEIDLRETQLPISAQDAVKTAMDAVGAGFMHSIELDYDERDAAWEWEVKILDGSTDHEIEIDANSGEIVSQKKDTTDDQEQEISLTSPMSYDKALELATGKVDGPLRGWKLEWDDGRREYQFDLMQGTDEVEVTVDADSGEVFVD
ncbi:PepSY domain-containing protein [Microbacterium sp. USHLN186]|uniref:PepSY domain-containing protein n=1 Tax=Microbacterium sp. USHLN186 TaxID=3081286 RepID=UPI003016EDFA